MIKKIDRALAISCHPDDIEIGCGGTICKWVKEYNTEVFALVLTGGSMGGISDTRKQEQENAAKILGVKKVFWGNYEDTKVPVNREIINTIEEVISETNPDVILTHFGNDTHQDHRNLSNVVVTATRNRKNVLFFEGPTSINFTPSVFVDISESIETKRKALLAHESQINRTNIENRSIMEIAEANAIFRGVGGRVNYAEGFKPLRLFL